MSDDAALRLERVPTGVAGLDTILRDGLVRGGVYLFLARPGAGKTILGSQISFRHVAAGGRAVFLTLLAEAHARLIAQLRSFAFFDARCIGQNLAYIAGYDALQKEKLKGLTRLVRQIVRDHKATLLVIDGVVTAGAIAESELEMKEFVHALQVYADLVGCTTLLLTGPSEERSGQYALRTMVDGLVEMHLETLEMDAVRSIEVTKHRGSAALLGRHFFEISDAGITIYPRIEARYGKAVERPNPQLAPTGLFRIDGLDTMLGGGLRAGSIAMALGSPGSGKTLLALSLLAAGAREKEPGLYVGFSETPADLCRKAEAIGLPWGEYVKAGLIEVLWQSPLEVIADGLAEAIFANIRKRRVRRVVIDGLGGFQGSLVFAARAPRFFGALCNELRALGAMTLLLDEAPSFGEMESARRDPMAMLDNVLSLRQVERGGQLRRILSVVKRREGTSDNSPREFSIGARGFVVSPTPEDARGVAPAGGAPATPAEKGSLEEKPRGP